MRQITLHTANAGQVISKGTAIIAADDSIKKERITPAHVDIPACIFRVDLKSF
jgi:hypothetical protein